MNLKLFTKSYVKDFPWLQLAAETVRNHAQCKIFWTIVVDQGEKQLLKLPEAGNIIFQVYEIQEYWPEASTLGSGYIQQQWVKMNAHRVMGSDFFLNWDSDVMALRGFSDKNFKNPQMKPILYFTPFNDLIGGGDERIHRARQTYIKDVFHIPEAPFEWMRCMPIWMNGEILRIAESRHEWDDVRHLMELRRVEGLSEFNLIGQMSQMFFPDAFEYKNTNNSPPTWSGPIDSDRAIVCQLWSWGGKYEEARKALNL